MKDILKKSLPPLIVDYLRKSRQKYKKPQKSVERIFSDIKDQNKWSNAESVSGNGSELAVTEALRMQLPALLQSQDIQSILDLPCGDFNWMKEIDLSRIDYTGGDIVTSLIKENNLKYGQANIRFVKLDIINDKLPTCDLLMCRDCLVHFSYKDIYKTLLNIKKSNIKYVLFTSFVDIRANRDIDTGQWRPLNFEIMPFNFTKPLAVINEVDDKRNSKYPDKSLCLWKVSDINISFWLKLYAKLI